MKTRGRNKASGGREATTGRAESKKRGEGSQEKERGGGTKKASRGGETTERESRETDKGKRGTAETKKRQTMPSIRKQIDRRWSYRCREKIG